MPLDSKGFLQCLDCKKVLAFYNRDRQNRRLDSEQFRSAPRTGRHLCGRLRCRKTERTGRSAALIAHRGGSPHADMKRREFIALLGGGGLLLAAKVKRARGQQPAMPVVAFLNSAS